MNTSESNWDDVIEVINRLYDSHFKDEETKPIKRIALVTKFFSSICRNEHMPSNDEFCCMQRLYELFKSKVKNNCQFIPDALTLSILELHYALQPALIHIIKQQNGPQ